MSHKSLTELFANRTTLADNKLIVDLKSTNSTTSKSAGIELARKADEFGISVRDYLICSIETDKDSGLNGYEQALFELGLPLKNDYENGITLQAAADAFYTYPGTRALFPEVIDDVVRWATRQDQIETVDPMIANSRTINGNEMISTVIEDGDDSYNTSSISEGGRIPVRTLKTSESAVKLYKHGSGIRHTYEFSRRASIDLFVPHANRVARELSRSKVAAATAILVNGDGVKGAAGVTTQNSLNGGVAGTAADGQINWPHFMHWLVKRAQAGTPVDAVLMNYDGLFQWMMLFGKETGVNGGRVAEALNNAGINIERMPTAMSSMMAISPILSSTMANKQLLGFSTSDTLEELVEAGSDIQETERAIQNQTMTMVRTENTGYNLVYGDTRNIFDYNAADD